MKLADIQKNNDRSFVVGVVVVAGVVVYVGATLYSEVMGFSMFREGVPPDLLPVALVGILSVGLSALVLPLAWHFWAFEKTHRLVVTIFYLVDIAIMVGNALAGYAVARTGVVHPILALYRDWFLPITPILMLIGWAASWYSDPVHRRKTQQATFVEQTTTRLLDAAFEQAEGQDVSGLVEAVTNAVMREVGADLRAAVTARVGAQVDEDEEFEPALALAPVPLSGNGHGELVSDEGDEDALPK